MKRYRSLVIALMFVTAVATSFRDSELFPRQFAATPVAHADENDGFGDSGGIGGYGGETGGGFGGENAEGGIGGGGIGGGDTGGGFWGGVESFFGGLADALGGLFGGLADALGGLFGGGASGLQGSSPDAPLDVEVMAVDPNTVQVNSYGQVVGRDVHTGDWTTQGNISGSGSGDLGANDWRVPQDNPTIVIPDTVGYPGTRVRAIPSCADGSPQVRVVWENRTQFCRDGEVTLWSGASFFRDASDRAFFRGACTGDHTFTTEDLSLSAGTAYQGRVEWSFMTHEGSQPGGSLSFDFTAPTCAGTSETTGDGGENGGGSGDGGNGPGTPAPTAPTFSVSPDSTPETTLCATTLLRGTSATLSWSCADSTSALGFNFSTGGNPSGETAIAPEEDTTYSLQCGNGATASCQVAVVDPALSIAATPARIRPGDSTTISWSAQNVTSCTVSGPTLSASGTTGAARTGSLFSQSTFTLSCRSQTGVRIAQTTVTLAPSFEEF